MKICGNKKITTGYVIQTYNEHGVCIHQEFVAGQVEWEDEDGNSIDMPTYEHQPYDMVQPTFIGFPLFLT